MLIMLIERSKKKKAKKKTQKKDKLIQLNV